MRRLPCYGPWGVVFTALFVIGICTGCRQAAPLAPPRLGWARLEALLPEHPGQRMVADIDHQLSSLLQQRAHLLAQHALALPHEHVMPPRPLPALRPPESPALPERLPTSTQPSTDAALTQEQAYRWQRDYLRKKRDMGTRYAAQLSLKLDALKQSAADDRRKVEEKYLTSLTNAELRHNLLVTQLQSAQEYLTAHPKTLRGTENVNAERDKAACSKRLAENNTELDSLQHQLDGEVLQINETLRQQDEKAIAANQHEFTQELLTLRNRLTDNAKQQVADEQQSLDTGIVEGQAVSSPEPVTYPTLPGVVVQVAHREVTDGMHTANDASRQDAEKALAVIDGTIAKLRRQRQGALTALARDVQGAACTVAAQHGYQLTFVAGHGKNLTPEVARWLQEYW